MPSQTPETGAPERLMTLEEAAVAAGVSVRTLARYRRNGTLEVVRVGRRVMCTPRAIERALDQRPALHVAHELLADDQLDRSLDEWLQQLLELAVAYPQYEDPLIQRAYNDALRRRLPGKRVRDLTLRELRGVHVSLLADGIDSVPVRAMLAFADDDLVLHTLRLLRRHFGW